MKINRYEDISQIDREAKRDFIDRHSAFVYSDSRAVKGEKFKVKIKIGNEYKHPDDFDHYISWVQLWDGERMLADASFLAGAQGGAPSQVEVDFYIVAAKTMKLTALSYCTKHGLWQSEETIVEVEG
jgi:superoxide reductase